MKKFGLDAVAILDKANEKFKTIEIPVFPLNSPCPCGNSLIFSRDFRLKKLSQINSENFRIIHTNIFGLAIQRAHLYLLALQCRTKPFRMTHFSRLRRHRRHRRFASSKIIEKCFKFSIFTHI